ncbi:MAG TPA: hypothetical protein VJJ75_02485 [Candidatus Nanoarchaeia archaeon]|nr:hypothetical protein [Candidatus Nanoarchaeia archaeon]
MTLDNMLDTQEHAQKNPEYACGFSYDPKRKLYRGLFNKAFLENCSPQQMRHMVEYLGEILRPFSVDPRPPLVTEFTATSDLLTIDGISINTIVITRYNGRQAGTLMQTSLRSPESFIESQLLRLLHCDYKHLEIPTFVPSA